MVQALDIPVRHPEVITHFSAAAIAEEGLPWWLAQRGWSEATIKSEGRGVRVGVLDSGFDSLWWKKPDWNFRIKAGMDFTGMNNPVDGAGHGTAVAGVIVRVAPQVDLYIARVLDRFGSGSDQSIKAGIDWLIPQVDIINGSLGSEVESLIMTAACKRAWDAGVLPIFASGNSGDAVLCHPAAGESTCSVASHGPPPDLKISSFSSPSDVNCAAAGERIVSIGLNGSMVEQSGTSFAASMTSGAAAMAIGYCKSLGIPWTPKTILDAIEATSEDIAETGRDPRAGAGAIRYDRLLSYFEVPIKRDWKIEFGPWQSGDREYAFCSRPADKP